jgi:HEPN domain-containing protein
MNRTDFRQIARIRLEEAKILLDNGKFDGAYYLSGYVIECALKACICKKTNRYDFPPDRKSVEECYNHDLERLIGAAELSINLKNEINRNHQFSINWTIVKDWDETSRYEIQTMVKARDLYSAITDRRNGVLKWIRQYW